MPFELILANINRHIDLNDSEKDIFLSCLESRKIKKQHFWIHEGHISSATAFVNSGCMRAYTIDNNGFEHILQFAPRDWWIADMYSFITQKPGYLNIDALEDSELVILSKENLERLYIEVPKFERFFRIITEKSLVANRQRIIENLSLSASQRYAIFCNTYPTIINSIPQKQIAAYIGVTPEFLSKMRSEFLRR